MYMGVYKYNMVVVGAQIIICVHRGKEDKALDKVKYKTVCHLNGSQDEPRCL